ncbi:calcium/proton exchanger [Hyaloscypha hepaticicola]|uniref:Vacuolar calcium ion transporter n=1 Tax=Hyaloscypha hepaticicola TaxID=2082293 RepID=A0A2J6PK53_9HELO|nr:calcium/proton exchanger [Hyaloscypha hepaticicola]
MTTLYSSKANYLLFLVPLSVVASKQQWNSVSVFALSFLAIFPLAELLSWSTEQLAKSTGQIIGGLLNATFGNAVEMIVGVTALIGNEFQVVQASMVGSILSGTLLIFGSTLFVAGYRTEEVKFNMDMTSIMSSLMIVSSASLIIPTASYFADMGAGSDIPSSNDYILDLSHVAALLLFAFYIIYLIFQLRTHASIFASSNEEEGDPELDLWAASFVLILATVGVSVCSDGLVDSIDETVEQLGVSRAFIGLILVPIVGNAGEFVATIHQARKDNVDFAISMIVGATLQIALFVTPVLVLLGWIINRPMSLKFDTFQTTVLAMSVIVVNCLVRDGRSNYFEGFLLLGTYLIVAIAFYVKKDPQEILASVQAVLDL